MSLEAAAYNEARLARIAAEAGSGPSVKLSVPFFQSGTWTAPQDGVLEMRAMGAGGGGANRGSGAGVGSGGYAGAWGVKVVRVSKDEVVTIAVGAGGASPGAAAAAGLPGGATTITHKSITRTAPGGLGGVYAASGTPSIPNGLALPAGDWDFGASSVKPGVIASGITGGAGVDILAKGGNFTTSASTIASGGGGTGGPSIGVVGGGATPVCASANGQQTPADSAGIHVSADSGEWVISFYGGSGGRGNGVNGLGGNGGGGAGNNSSGAPGDGGNGGGGGASTGASGGKGGLGGGGGAAPSSAVQSGLGGNGYACLHFYPDTGV